MNKTKQKEIFARLRRHDAGDLSRLMAGTTKDGTEWVLNVYWAVKRTEWAWAELLPAGIGSYYVHSNGLSQYNDKAPDIDQLFRPGWLDGDKATPLMYYGVPTYSAAGYPLLHLGETVIAVDLAKVSDMLCTNDELVYADIDGQVLYSYVAPKVRLTGDIEHPLQPLTVWRPAGPTKPGYTGEWRPVGIIMPAKVQP